MADREPHGNPERTGALQRRRLTRGHTDSAAIAIR